MSPYYIPEELGGPVIPQALGSIFVASYDSQGYGGGIRPRLHSQSQSKSHIATDGQSVS
jgi:hypothetical protein